MAETQQSIIKPRFPVFELLETPGVPVNPDRIPCQPTDMFNLGRPHIERYAPAEIEYYRRAIAGRVAERSFVKDARRGYVICEEVNGGVNPLLMSAASIVAVGDFLARVPEEELPTAVVGISNRGKQFASFLSRELRLTDGVTERLPAKPGEEEFSVRFDPKSKMIIITGICSFTKPGEIFTHTIRNVYPGDKVLVADDFIARLHAIEQFRRAFNELGTNPLFVAVVAKDLPDVDPPQNGYRKARENDPIGDRIYAVTIINEIGPDGGKAKTTSENIPATYNSFIRSNA